MATLSGQKRRREEEDKSVQLEHLSAGRNTINGQRCIAPYPHLFSARVKKRWLGTGLLTMFANDFGSHDESYFRRAIAAGAITVNGRVVAPEHRLKDGETIHHWLHRHEPAVPATAIEKLLETEDFVAVCKPGGIPVHPSGPFRYNSLVSLLCAELGLPMLHPCHRLDRLTSGVVLLAKSTDAARRIGERIRQTELHKRYLAKVKGRFPQQLQGTQVMHAGSEGKAREKAGPAAEEEEEQAGGGGGGEGTEAESHFISTFIPALTEAQLSSEAAGGDKEEGTGERDTETDAAGASSAARGKDEERKAEDACAPAPAPAGASDYTWARKYLQWSKGGWLRVAVEVVAKDQKHGMQGIGPSKPPIDEISVGTGSSSSSAAASSGGAAAAGAGAVAEGAAGAALLLPKGQAKALRKAKALAKKGLLLLPEQPASCEGGEQGKATMAGGAAAAGALVGAAAAPILSKAVLSLSPELLAQVQAEESARQAAHAVQMRGTVSDHRAGGEEEGSGEW